jgi:hypothetical protein
VQLDLRSLFRFLQFGQHFAFLNYEVPSTAQPPREARSRGLTVWLGDVQVAQAELHPDKYIANLKEFYTYAEVSPQDYFSSPFPFDSCISKQPTGFYSRRGSRDHPW